MLTYCAMLKDKEQKRAFEDLYLTYRSSMYAIAYKVINNPAGTEDAVQEALFKMAKRFDELDGLEEERLKSFVVTITQSAAIDLYRKNARSDLPMRPEEMWLDEEQNAPSPEKIICDAESYELLVEQIRNLPEIYANVLTLYYLHHVPVPVIAEMLGMLEATVRSRLDRGKAHLLRALQKEVAEA